MPEIGEITPDVGAEEETPVRRELSITAEENEWLSTADPHSAEVQDFMTSHGIGFGDTITTHIEGRDTPLVVTADEGDFWTSLRDETALAAEHARTMMGENPEHEELAEDLRDEAAQDLGEEAAELTTEVDDGNEVEEHPDDEEAPEEEEKKEQSGEEVKQLLADFSATLPARFGRIRDAVQEYDSGNRAFKNLEGVADLLSRLAVRMQDYDRAGFSRAVEGISGEMQRISSAIAASEAKGNDIEGNLKLAKGDIARSIDAFNRLSDDAFGEELYSQGFTRNVLDEVMRHEDDLGQTIHKEVSGASSRLEQLRSLKRRIDDIGSPYGPQPTEDDVRSLKNAVLTLAGERIKPLASELDLVTQDIQHTLRRVELNPRI